MDKQRDYTEKLIFLREKLTWDLRIPDHTKPRLHMNMKVYHHHIWFSHPFLGSIYVKPLNTVSILFDIHLSTFVHYSLYFYLFFPFEFKLNVYDLFYIYLKHVSAVRKKNSFKVHSTHFKSFLKVLNFLYFKPILPMLLNIHVNIKECILP
jgi:hypothetical protein